MFHRILINTEYLNTHLLFVSVYVHLLQTRQCYRQYFMEIFTTLVESLNSPVYFAPPCMLEICVIFSYRYVENFSHEPNLMRNCHSYRLWHL